MKSGGKNEIGSDLAKNILSESFSSKTTREQNQQNIMSTKLYEQLKMTNYHIFSLSVKMSVIMNTLYIKVIKMS